MSTFLIDIDIVKQTRRDNLEKLINETSLERTDIAEALGCSKQFVHALLCSLKEKNFSPLNDNHIRKIVEKFGEKHNFDETYFNKGLEKIFNAKIENPKDEYEDRLKDKNKIISMLEKENQELKEHINQKALCLERIKVANLQTRPGDPEGFDPMSERCQAFAIFKEES